MKIVDPDDYAAVRSPVIAESSAAPRCPSSPVASMIAV
jgi:hypothetical protein